MSDRELMQRYRMALEAVGVASNINDAYRIVKKALELQPKEIVQTSDRPSNWGDY
jgi:phage gp45-like